MILIRLIKGQISCVITKNKNIAIVSNFDDNYSKIFCSFLLSASYFFNKKFNYDIIVISSNISDKNKRLLNSIVEDKVNIRLRYTNPQSYLNGIDKKIVHQEYSEDLYYRVVIPYILSNYDKVLVVDADTIIKKDLSELFNIDISNYLCAAVKDTVMQGYLNGMVPDQFDYIKTVLNIDDPYDYFNSGVILLNCSQIRKEYSLDKLREVLIKYIPIVRIYEQDILNLLFNKRVKFIEQRWNFFTRSNPFVSKCIDIAPLSSFLNYQKASLDPFIIHYAAQPKPWNNLQADFGDKFWEITRNSPYYEQLLLKDLSSKNLNKFLIKNYSPIFKYLVDFSLCMEKLKYKRLSFLSKVTFGNKKKHYKNKKNISKQKIKEIKTIGANLK